MAYGPAGDPNAGRADVDAVARDRLAEHAGASLAGSVHVDELAADPFPAWQVVVSPQSFTGGMAAYERHGALLMVRNRKAFPRRGRFEERNQMRKEALFPTPKTERTERGDVSGERRPALRLIKSSPLEGDSE
jgi:hypothetical protein